LNKRKLLFIAIVPCILFFSCSLQGKNPEVVSVSIHDGQKITDVASFQKIEITFSKHMNCYTTEKNISLSGYYGKMHFQWLKGNKSVIILLDELLETGCSYVLVVGSGCECEEGYDLAEDFVRSFYTYEIVEGFSVVMTSPVDGETLSALDGLVISVEFTLPVFYATIYDKIRVTPELAYNYTFSSDRKTLMLEIMEHVEPNENYTVSISKDLCALEGQSLKEEYRFSFDTVISTDAFLIDEARMENSREAIPVNFHDYLACTSGIEKDMELKIKFNADVYLHEVRNHISIDPPADYRLEKGENYTLRISFDEYMDLEQRYRITFKKSLTNTAGIFLPREYCFEWTVDGDDSRYVRPSEIRMVTPLNASGTEAPPDTVVYDGETVFPNKEMMVETVFDGVETYNLARFEIRFPSDMSYDLDIYRSLDKFLLSYQYGDIAVISGELTDFEYFEQPEDQTGILQLTFRLEMPVAGGTAYYKFIVIGGKGGIADTGGNYLENDIEVYVKYVI
jgi:hypothetical protein